jgi:hypothetical protein
MFDYTLDNHLSYTIGGRQFGQRETITERFEITVGKIDPDYYRTSDWLTEQYRTADILHRLYGSELTVLFSGGTDSEIVLRAFVAIGVRPHTVFIKFKNDYNHDDYVIAQRVCDELGVNLTVIDFDVKKFYYSGAAAYWARQLQCSQIAYLIVYYNFIELQRPCVMGGELLFRRDVRRNTQQWYYCWRENEDCASIRASILCGIPLINEWFSYTPEMMGYYLDNPKICELFNTRYNYKLASVSSKNAILEQYMPSILKKEKTHGYEKILGFNIEAAHNLRTQYCARLEPSLDGIYIDELRTKLFAGFK